MRIAKEKGISIDSLRGEEFEALKDFNRQKKMEDLINNISDFTSESIESISEIKGRC